MLRSLLMSVALTAAFLCGGAGPLPPAAPAAATCVRYWPEARYRPYGYDHVVHLESQCDAPAQCTVATDVDAQENAVTLAAHASAEVVTRQGSPSREFRPIVSCQLQARRR